jgi:rhodanese-related sulfurtransferase
MDGEVTTEAVAAMLEGPDDVCVVDVRSRSAYARGHIPGSVCIPFREVAGAADRVADADRVVTVCPHGESSVRAARLLAAAAAVDEDTPVESMAGGLTAWDGDLVAGEDESAAAPF